MIESVIEQFRWVDGHADIWRVFRDPDALNRIVTALAEPYRGSGVTTVAGIESRGFLLGGAVAVALGVGFTAVRKRGGIFPGPKLRRVTSADYRGNETTLLMQQEALEPGDRVLMVDDWIETGSQAVAAQSMVAERGATLIGIAVVVDGLADDRRGLLPPVHGLVRQDQL